MENTTDRDYLRWLADRPIGGDGVPSDEAAARANKVRLPAGKRSGNTREARKARKEFFERQTDVEDAVEAAGGQRGSLNHKPTS